MQFPFKLISLLFLRFLLFPNWSFPMCESLVRTMYLEGQAALLLKQDQKRSHCTPLSYSMLFSPMLCRLLLLFSYTAITHQICFLFHPCVFQDIKSCQFFCITKNTSMFPWNMINYILKTRGWSLIFLIFWEKLGKYFASLSCSFFLFYFWVSNSILGISFYLFIFFYSHLAFKYVFHFLFSSLLSSVRVISCCQSSLPDHFV